MNRQDIKKNNNKIYMYIIKINIVTFHSPYLLAVEYMNKTNNSFRKKKTIGNKQCTMLAFSLQKVKTNSNATIYF